MDEHKLGLALGLTVGFAIVAVGVGVSYAFRTGDMWFFHWGIGFITAATIYRSSGWFATRIEQLTGM